MTTRKVSALALVALLGVLACNERGRFPTGRTGLDQTSLTLALTDSPDSLLDSVTVFLGRIEIVSASGTAVVLTQIGGAHDLALLQGGETAALVTTDIPVGSYARLRVFVDSARVRLRQGLTFNDSTVSRTVAAPPGTDSGVTISLDVADGDPLSEGVVLGAGEATLVVDFDVFQSFEVSTTGVAFTPQLRAALSGVAGTVSGTLTSSLGLAVGGVTIFAAPAVSGTIEPFQTASATAVTDSLGGYTIRFLPPGSYTLTVNGVGTLPSSRTTTVGAGAAVTGVDFDRTS